VFQKVGAPPCGVISKVRLIERSRVRVNNFRWRLSLLRPTECSLSFGRPKWLWSPSVDRRLHIAPTQCIPPPLYKTPPPPCISVIKRNSVRFSEFAKGGCTCDLFPAKCDNKAQAAAGSWQCTRVSLLFWQLPEHSGVAFTGVAVFNDLQL
jgi:hypothetical protein